MWNDISKIVSDVCTTSLAIVLILAFFTNFFDKPRDRRNKK